jgi:hypothetical protein
MEFREIYCYNCKKVLGKYNMKYYNDDKIGDMIKSNYGSHIRQGHEIRISKVSTKS